MASGPRLRILSTDGLVERVVPDAADRRVIGAHHNAVGRFLSADGGDPAVLERFVDVRVAGVMLETDPDALVEFWLAGEMDFLEIYTHT